MDSKSQSQEYDYDEAQNNFKISQGSPSNSLKSQLNHNRVNLQKFNSKIQQSRKSEQKSSNNSDGSQDQYSDTFDRENEADNAAHQNIPVNTNQAKMTFAQNGASTSNYSNPFKSGTPSNQKKKKTGGFQGETKQRARLPLYTNKAKNFIINTRAENAQQKITTALQQNNKQTFSGLDKTIVDRVIAKNNTNNPKDVNILQNSNQIATSKKPRQPISFKDENAMNAAIKKQKKRFIDRTTQS